MHRFVRRATVSLPPDLDKKIAQHSSAVLAAPKSERLKAFTLAARYVFGLVSEPEFPAVKAADRLQVFAEAIGLVAEHGDDAIQQRLEAASSDPIEDDENDEPTRDFFGECICDAHGKPIPNLANALTALRAALPNIVGLDEFSKVAILRRPLQRDTSFVPRPINDVDVGLIQERLQHLGLRRLSAETAHQAIDVRAAECGFHPVRQYLENLEWDGVQRTGPWLTDYLGSNVLSIPNASDQDS
jgi:hypothetical protein